MDSILERVSRVESQISLIKNKVVYRDLRKMLANIDRKITELSKEDVECRRLKKATLKYKKLEQEVTELLDVLEQHVTFAALL